MSDITHLGLDMHKFDRHGGASPRQHRDLLAGDPKHPDTLLRLLRRHEERATKMTAGGNIVGSQCL